MLLINTLTSSCKATVSQGAGNYKMKSGENKSLSTVMGKSLTTLKIEEKFFLNFQLSTLVTRTEYISHTSPHQISILINFQSGSKYKHQFLKNGQST